MDKDGVHLSASQNISGNSGDRNSAVNTGFTQGSNQLGMKQHNEKLVIDVVRRMQAVSKADITRITKLSAQTITIIANRLIEEGLLNKGETVRGKVGQPSVLLELNPQGALSIGVKLGRRTSQVMVMSFTFEVLAEKSFHYDYPDNPKIVNWIETSVSELIQSLSAEQQARLVGIGLAMPDNLDLWEGVIDAPEGTMKAWKHVDITSWLQQKFKLPVTEINDATAACVAELSQTHRQKPLNCLYFYIGTFFGAGLALDGRIYEGHSGKAGAVASLPLSLPTAEHPPQQMVSAAGLHTLETELISRGYDRTAFLSEQQVSDELNALFDSWADEAGKALAFAIAGGQCFLDTPDVIIDGRLSPALIARLIDKVKASFTQFDVSGITLPQLTQGQLGAQARPMGAAIMPLHAHFSLHHTHFHMQSL